MSRPYRRPRRVRAFVHVTTIVIAAAMSGCALGPTRDDPFEPMNRVSYQVHQVVDGRIVKPIAQAYVDYTPKPVRQGPRRRRKTGGFGSSGDRCF